jgi:hypothetical protein
LEIISWLCSLGLQQYDDAFRQNAIDAEVLLDLTAEDLRDLGVTLIGHRRKLLAAIAALRAERPGSRQPANGFGKQSFTVSTAYCCSPKTSLKQRRNCCGKRYRSPGSSRRNRWSCAPRPIWRGYGASRGGAARRMPCWRWSMAGSTEGFDTTDLKEAAALLSELT